MPIDPETPDAEETLTWLQRREAPALGAGDLHLWRIRTGVPDGDGGRPLAADLELLDESQRTRAQGLIRSTARGHYVRAQAGLRRILALYLHAASPSSLVFSYGPAGKPALEAAPAGLEFNLTTAGDLALVGISLASAVGVDCERVRPRPGLIAIARRMFEPAQAEAIAALSEEAALGAFYRCWTALEADAKSDGRGLFRPRASGVQRPEVRHCVPAPGYVAAVARAQLPPLGLWRTLELASEPSG
jgi:4'-phosphopantetheinyl transferase